MSTAIRIDTELNERKHGKPVGRAFWTFKIISPTVTINDKVYSTDTPVTFQVACQRAREIATLRRSELIVLLPQPGA